MTEEVTTLKIRPLVINQSMKKLRKDEAVTRGVKKVTSGGRTNEECKEFNSFKNIVYLWTR